jgi:hypothetical protein
MRPRLVPRSRLDEVSRRPLPVSIPSNQNGQAIFTQAANDCRRRGTADPVAPATSMAKLNPCQRAVTPSLRGVRAEHAAISSLTLSQRKFCRSKSPLAALKTDKGSGDGEATNHRAERNVAEDGRRRKWKEDWVVAMAPDLTQSHEPVLGDLECQALLSSPQAELRLGARREVLPRGLMEWA